MEGEFDQNKIIAEFINLKINDFVSIGTSILQGTKQAIQIELKTVYKKYLNKSFKRYGKSKTFFYRDESVSLNSFYVPMGVQCGEVLIKSANLNALLEVNSYLTISGTGGAGKSIMMKHLFINSLFAKKQIPVFIELRDINSKDLKLQEFIFHTFSSYGLKVDSKFLIKSMEKGQFIFFLDGLDEVYSTKRIELIKEIDEFTKKYSNCSIILSTRPDLNISELGTFHNFKILPLNLEQSIKLVKKLPADLEIKSKFINDLKSFLFVKHSSFLSNPLLLSIMLITYGYSADIPNKLSLFYNQAFEALFQRHDALKGAYKRKRATTLDIQEFSKILSIFCILSYEKRKFKFSKTEALEFLNQAKILSCYKFEESDFLTDLLQSVCLLIEDGFILSFTHRSFQEYFAAKFIVSAQSNIKKELLEKYQSNIREDSVYKLVHELDPDFIEFEILIPFLNNLFKEIKLNKNIGILNYLRFIKVMWTKFEFRNGKLIGTVKDGIVNELVYFIILNINTNNGLKPLERKESEWINEMKKKSKNDSKPITYYTKDLKAADKASKEFYSSSRFFSKGALELLKEVKNKIESRKIHTSEKLFDLLLKEKT